MVYLAPSNQDEGDLLTGTRVCRLCDERRSMTAFHWTANRKYRTRVCSTCQTSRARDRRESDREAVARRSFLKNLRIAYGMTEEDYLALLAAQDGACAVCRSEFGDQAPHVDHDHETGVVRGLLCFTCNTAIGKMRDDPALLRAAAAYLEQPPPVITGRPRALSSDELRQIRSRAASKGHGRLRGVEAA